jgi:hypothetical protein
LTTPDDVAPILSLKTVVDAMEKSAYVGKRYGRTVVAAPLLAHRHPGSAKTLNPNDVEDANVLNISLAILGQALVDLVVDDPKASQDHCIDCYETYRFCRLGAFSYKRRGIPARILHFVALQGGPVRVSAIRGAIGEPVPGRMLGDLVINGTLSIDRRKRYTITKRGLAVLPYVFTAHKARHTRHDCVEKWWFNDARDGEGQVKPADICDAFDLSLVALRKLARRALAIREAKIAAFEQAA